MPAKPPYIHPGFPPKNPPPQPANNVFRILVQYDIEEQKAFNTFFYADDASVRSAVRADLQEIGSLFLPTGGVMDAIVQCITGDGTVMALIVDCPTSPTLAPVITDLSRIGQVTGAHLPTQMAVTIAKLTHFRGKQGRGRLSVPVVPTKFCADSIVINKTPFDALGAAMLIPLIGATKSYRPGLYSPDKKYAGDGITIEEVNQSWVDIVKMVTREVLGTCRRRKLGVGK